MSAIHFSYGNISKVTKTSPVTRSGNVFKFEYPCSNADCTYFQLRFNPGVYKVELWGASGGYLDNSQGGKGAYASGYMTLFHPETLYLYLGEQGSWSGPPTFNGGGYGTIGITDRNSYVSGGSGGGASDLRLLSGSWNDFESLKS